jgi:hypothetical protein
LKTALHQSSFGDIVAVAYFRIITAPRNEVTPVTDLSLVCYRGRRLTLFPRVDIVTFCSDAALDRNRCNRQYHIRNKVTFSQSTVPRTGAMTACRSTGSWLPARLQAVRGSGRSYERHSDCREHDRPTGWPNSRWRKPPQIQTFENCVSVSQPRQRHDAAGHAKKRRRLRARSKTLARERDSAQIVAGASLSTPQLIKVASAEACRSLHRASIAAEDYIRNPSVRR